MIPYNLVSFAQGTSFTFLLCASIYFLIKKGNRLHYTLGLTLAYWFILATKNLFLIALNIPNTIFVWHLGNIIDMTAVPFCIFIIMEIMNPHWLNWKRFLINELPFLIIIPIYILYPLDIVYNIILYILIFYLIIAMIIVGEKVHNYHAKLKQTFSYTENINIEWLIKALIAFVFLSIIWIYSCIQKNQLADVLFSFGVCVSWGLVCYFINKQLIVPNDYSEPQEIIWDKDKEISNEGSAYPILQRDVIEENYKFGSELSRIFEKEKIYLNSKLNLNEVASLLNTNRTYLSDYLNRVMNTNFYDYVNEYRIEYASMLLHDSPSLTLEVVAEKSGFNSLSTFRRTFMKRYGCTPHSYRKHPAELL